jgi:uncharacterized protein (DUF2062 family)
MAVSPRLARWFEQLLHTHDTPQRTAAAYALGVFWGFSPPLGLHTILGITCAFLLGLNRVAVILGVYSNLPWLVPAYYTLATLVGAGVLGVSVQPRAVEDAVAAVAAAAWGDFSGLRRTFTPLLWSYTVGSTLGAIVLAAVAYRVSLEMILAHRRRLARAQQESPDL